MFSMVTTVSGAMFRFRGTLLNLGARTDLGPDKWEYILERARAIKDALPPPIAVASSSGPPESEVDQPDQLEDDQASSALPNELPKPGAPIKADQAGEVRNTLGTSLALDSTLDTEGPPRDSPPPPDPVPGHSIRRSHRGRRVSCFLSTSKRFPAYRPAPVIWYSFHCPIFATT
jgi:hypothetical protein